MRQKPNPLHHRQHTGRPLEQKRAQQLPVDGFFAITDTRWQRWRVGVVDQEVVVFGEPVRGDGAPEAGVGHEGWMVGRLVRAFVRAEVGRGWRLGRFGGLRRGGDWRAVWERKKRREGLGAEEVYIGVDESVSSSAVSVTLLD